MNKLILSASVVALALSAGGSAFAADLPSRKAAPVYVAPPPAPMWTGFYVGLNAGGTFGGNELVNVGTYGLSSNPALAGSLAVASASALAGTGNFSINNGGFIGGGQIGYNWQWNSFVLGLEADIQGIAGSNSTATAVTGAGIAGFPLNALSGTVSTSKTLDYLGTVRGRIGYLFTPTLLVYGTGGLAYGGANASTSVFQSLSGPVAPGLQTVFGTTGSYSDTLVGWTAGAGLEWMFMPNWSAKLEYLYYDLGTVSYGSGVVASMAAGGANFFTNVVSTTTKFDGHIVRAGVNYHFNWGAAAPVLAKY